VVADHILDFYSGLVRIAVEVDGKMNDPALDRERDEFFEKKARVATVQVPARGGVSEHGRGLRQRQGTNIWDPRLRPVVAKKVS
jgi:hypothetical protein